MKTYLVGALLTLAIVIPLATQAQNATQPMLNAWRVVSGYILPNNSANGLRVPALGSTGNPCLSVGTTGIFATTTCGSGGAGATTTINGFSGPAFTFATSSVPGLNFLITGSGSTITFAPAYGTGYSIPLNASSTEWSTAYGWGNHASAGYLTASALTPYLTTTTAASTYQPLLTNPVIGTGTPTQIAFFTATSTLNSDSNLYWDNTNKALGVGGTPGTAKLYVNGNVGIGTTTPTALLVVATSTSQSPFVVTSAGNVGIGTTNPQQKLVVVGDLRATGALYDSNASAGTAGNLLMTTGSAYQWTATSSLFNGVFVGTSSAATILAANGANCSSGQSPLGVDQAGAVESCFDVWTEAENTSADYLQAADITNLVTYAYASSTFVNYTYASSTFVTAVTGSGNIASSGGLTPNITFTGVLPRTSGGTGTTTLGNLTVSSSNLSITGGQQVLIGTSTEITLTANPTFTKGIFTNTSTTNITIANILFLPGMADGCLQVGSGIATSTGTNCGTGVGGGGGVATTSPYTAGYIPYATSTLALTNSSIFDFAHKIGIGTTTPEQTLVVVGSTTITSLGAGLVRSTAVGSLYIDTATYLTGNQTITLSGDVSGSGATSITTAIGNDKVTEAMLKVVDTPADEDIFTYESTTGDFEWHTPAQLNLPTFSYASTSYATLWNILAGSNISISTSSGFSIAVVNSPSFSGTLSVTGTSTLATTLVSGRLGVGTTTPDTPLVVVGSSTLSSYGSCTLKTTAAGVILCGTDNTNEGNIAWTIGAGLIYNATSTDEVGIGTSSPDNTLTIQGNGAVNPFRIASSTGANLLSLDTSGNLTVAGALTLGTDLSVANGGSGASTFTDHGVLVGSGTDPFTALSVGTNGQLLIGSTGADPVFAALNCADNLTCTTGAGTLEIDLDASIVVTNASTTGLTAVDSFLGTVRSGLWNGTVIGTTFGGTGTTTAPSQQGQFLAADATGTKYAPTRFVNGAGITITTSTPGSLTIASTLGTSVDLTSEVTGILPVANGGTNSSTLGSTLVGFVINGTNVTGSIANNTLTLGWTGDLAVADGGTGAGTLTGMLKGNGTSAFTGVTGTLGYGTRWSDANTIATGALIDNGTVAGINATSSTIAFNVQGAAGVNDIFNAASSTGTSVLKVSTLSRVGINTSSPVAILQVQGTTGANNTIPLLDVASSSGASLFRVQANGNVGIGSSTPSSFFTIDGGTAATSTVIIDSTSGTKGACLVLKDADGSGYTYCTASNGTLTCSTTNCQ